MLATRTWLVVANVLCLLPSSGFSATFDVAGIALNERLAQNSSKLQGYTCKEQSQFFFGLRACTRVQTENVAGRRVRTTNSLLARQSGDALYIETLRRPLSLTKADVERELAALSRKFSSPPNLIEWEGSESSGDGSVIASWGKLTLEQMRTFDEDMEGREGILVDTLADPQRSAKEFLPLYRIAGGGGYVYTASFGKAAAGHRQHIAIDSNDLLVSYYKSAVSEILRKDEKLSANDISLWPKVAKRTRQLSRNITPEAANAALSQAYQSFTSKKFLSRVWSILPGGTIDGIAQLQYSTVDIYPPETEHPDIRKAILEFLATKPQDRFVELLHYVIGDFRTALSTDRVSQFAPLFNYALGFETMRSLLKGILEQHNQKKQAPNSTPPSDDGPPQGIEEGALHDLLRTANEVFDKQKQPSQEIFAEFRPYADAARPYFEAVLHHRGTAHADDAAYMLGWLALHQGQPQQALQYFTTGMTVGNGDYSPGAIARVVRMIAQLPTAEQRRIVDKDPVLIKQPAIIYTVTRSLYREHDYVQTIEAARLYLEALGIQPDDLPATTDPKRISTALEKLVGVEASSDYNLQEIPYLLQASKEILEFQAILAGEKRLPELQRRATNIIQKYSKLIDDQEDFSDKPAPVRQPSLSHRDLRQARYLVDMTLQRTSNDSQYAPFREWLYYRRARLASRFDPPSILQTVSLMAAEFPKSELMDDALAEQLMVQGIVLNDFDGAKATFEKLLQTFPNGNAIDNAYSWMALISACTDTEEANRLNNEIIRRFPLTRHAKYARERLSGKPFCIKPTE